MSQFIINAGDLMAAFKQLKPFMSKEETRYYLCGINIHNKGDDLRFAATDGHKLCVYSHDYDYYENESGKDFNVILPRQSVKTAMVIAKKVKKDFPVVIKTDGKKLTIVAPDEEATFKLIDGTFPDYEKVIPSQKEAYRVGLEKAQAKEAMQAISTFTSRDALTLNFFGDCEPVKIVSENSTIVVMPTRQEFEDKII